MALPIKQTPVLTGKNAKKFIKIMKENEHRSVPKTDYERAQKVYDALKDDFLKV